MLNANENIPPQKLGDKTDVIHFVDEPGREAAHNLFLLAKARLKDVSRWHNISGPGSAKFSLTDSQGSEVFKTAEKGDLFYIDLPSVGSRAGDGLEWVRIEAMEEVDNAEGETEYITLTVRPVVNPRHPDKAIAHFYSHESTNTFIVERYLNHVSAAVHGRNETPNTEDTGIFDTVRNTIIGLTARNGVADPQWKAFTEGILKR